jgi:hypothetical protein
LTAEKIPVTTVINACRDPKDNLFLEAESFAGRPISDAVPLLLNDLLTDDTNNIRKDHRVSAAYALSTVGPSMSETIKGLLTALDDSSGTVRRAVVSNLTHIAKSSEEARSALKKCLKHQDPDVRKAALRSLGSRERWSDEVLDFFLHGIYDNSYYVRLEAVQMLHQALATQMDVATQVIPRVYRLIRWPSRAHIRSTLLSVLAADPRVADDPHIYDIHLNHIASGLRSIFPSVRKAAYDALVEITWDRPLPSFQWHTVTERQKQRRKLKTLYFYINTPDSFKLP